MYLSQSRNPGWSDRSSFCKSQDLVECTLGAEVDLLRRLSRFISTSFCGCLAHETHLCHFV